MWHKSCSDRAQREWAISTRDNRDAGSRFACVPLCGGFYPPVSRIRRQRQTLGVWLGWNDSWLLAQTLTRHSRFPDDAVTTESRFSSPKVAPVCPAQRPNAWGTRIW